MATAARTLNARPLIEALKGSDVQFAVALVAIIFMMFVPLPPILLDMFLSISITLGFLTLLIAIYIKEPLEFSTFPTFLLLSTLFRLALNVATTRNILLRGASGEVSDVVSAFGNFVVEGNYFVGFVIFLILVIINFMVITKGAGRVAEVGARFTLDAMPGKQMSIDADLNAGIIDRDEARRRRTKIEQEADFYGSMDGASKFVRGDAIAGIIITAVNVIVGLTLGVVQHRMSFSDAAAVYTLLTVGDGLVTQIPSIIISVAAGIVVTRASGGNQLSTELSNQMFLQPKALYVCSGLLLGLAMMPGLPMLAFGLLCVAFFFFARYATREIDRRSLTASVAKEEKEREGRRKEDSIETLLHVDTLSLEVGVGLIPLVDTDQDGEVLERIVSSRKQFAQDMGIIVPMVMVRDNIQLKPGEYQILLKGQPVAKGSMMVEYELAMAPDERAEPLDGIRTKEPAYGLDAVWIRPNQRDEASFRGYTVVNCATVVVTHLTKVIQDYAHELIGRQEVANLVEGLKEKAPKVVEEVFASDGITLGTTVRILQNLLKEGVSIRDMLSIFESLADYGKDIKQADVLTRYVRKALGRGIVRKYLGNQDLLHVVTLDRAVEDLIVSSLSHHESGISQLNLDPQVAQSLLGRIAEAMSTFDAVGTIPILLCGSQVRWDLKRLVDRFIPGLVLLAFDEIPSDVKTQHLTTISL